MIPGELRAEMAEAYDLGRAEVLANPRAACGHWVDAEIAGWRRLIFRDAPWQTAEALEMAFGAFEAITDIARRNAGLLEGEIA